MIINIALIITGYLLGSIPSGLILTRMAGMGDIRDIGSGNIGTTNVLRTGSKKLAATTLLFDMLKGVATVLLVTYTSGDTHIIMGASLAAVIGHMYPVWLKFGGGKGVATTLGVALALHFPLGISMVAIWIAMAYWLRLSSLAALTAFGLAPVLALFVYGKPELAILCAMTSALVFWKHRENIQRLLNGSESKISFNKKEKK